MGDFDERFARRRRLEAPRLTDFDAAVLAPEARAAAVLVWGRRVSNETASCEVARRLEETARALSLEDGVLRSLERLREDEETHAALAREMVRLLGRPDFAPADVLGPLPAESSARSFVRQVVAALCIAESVSAARYAAVREATDLPVPHACIDLFLRDEVLHGRLGFDLLPIATARLEDEDGKAEALVFTLATIKETLLAFDLGVGLDSERRGMPEARPQPAGNPGIVEPAIDALAFYDAVLRSILPSFEAAGIPATEVWRARFATPRDSSRAP